MHDDKSKIGLEILVDLQRVKDDEKKLELYEKYKQGEIKQVEIREAIKKEKKVITKDSFKKIANRYKIDLCAKNLPQDFENRFNDFLASLQNS